MELDRYQPGSIVYTMYNALMTSDGTTTHLIAGNWTEKGYREGVGADVRFNDISGFSQLSEERVIVTDSGNRCLRQIDRTTHSTSVFSGQCESYGYQDGRPGQFNFPQSALIDKKNKNQLLITDYFNAAVRTVDVMSQAAGTLVKSDSLQNIRYIAQEQKSGDLYVTAYHAVYRITYIQITVSLISGSPGANSGYRDGKLLNCLFNYPHGLIFIAAHTLLVADYGNHRLRLLDTILDKSTTLNVKKSPFFPSSILLTATSMNVGQHRKIIQYECKYNAKYFHSL